MGGHGPVEGLPAAVQFGGRGRERARPPRAAVLRRRPAAPSGQPPMLSMPCSPPHNPGSEVGEPRLQLEHPLHTAVHRQSAEDFAASGPYQSAKRERVRWCFDT